MPLDLNQQAIGPTDPHADLPPEWKKYLDDIQGNILKSHGRDHSQHLFITFTDTAKAKAWLASMGEKVVTSASKQWKDSLKRRELFAEAQRHDNPAGWLDDQLHTNPSSVFVNVLLSRAGYAKLGIPDGRTPADAAFRRGAKSPETIKKLADPPVKASGGQDPKHQWEPAFQQDLHALVIIADDRPTDVQTVADNISKELKASGAGMVAHVEIGLVLRYGKNGPVREHFGFVDGVSNPAFYAKDVPKPPGGTFKYDPKAPLRLVLTKDPGGDTETGYGSYFVYRKLEQNLEQFQHDQFVLARALAQADGREAPNESDKELAGAYIVGRFRDGAPVSEFATESGVGKDIPNNFDFQQDKDGDKCPFQAHVRKTNPRGETGDGNERDHRIVRRAISFERSGKVGLLFLCAQSDISGQFEFMQASWCNNTGFLRSDTGLDPIVGQGQETEQEWPKKHGKSERIKVTLKQSVAMRGGEYFFMPSLSFLKKITT